MKRLRNLAVAGCTVFLLCQCATQDDVRDLSYQIRAVNKKVEDVQNSTVGQIQKRQASSVNRIDTVQNDFMKLQAMVEESEHQQSQAEEKIKKDIAALRTMIDQAIAEKDQSIQLLEQRITKLEGNIENMAQTRIREAEKRAREAAARAEEARQRTVVAAESGSGTPKVEPEVQKKKVDSDSKIEVAALPPAVETPVSKPEAPAREEPGDGLFDQGMARFNDKQYSEAYKLFEQYLAQNPSGGTVADTLYYMGESLYAEGEYDLAILDYQKVISNHANHQRTPTALLKQGMSFGKLTDHETAKIIFKKLISEYPDSAEAATAGQLLSQMQ
ncbi:MAG: tol-pal system protein YbgF [Desulfobulbaceae bacterium]|nr:tol-pal system protein YbgF [Desulfobulbaceae bacterium]